jgi:hypothetical protein
MLEDEGMVGGGGEVEERCTSQGGAKVSHEQHIAHMIA